MSSTDSNIIKILQDRNGQKKTTYIQLLVILKQKRNVKEDTESECIKTGQKKGRFEIKVRHLVSQVRSILKTKILPELEIEAFRRRLTTPQETVEVLNHPVESSDVAPVIKIGVEQNHPGSDGSHQNNDTQRIRKMMQENLKS